MQKPALPHNEKQRVEHLLALKILDTAPEERFDNITQLTSQIFSTPIALITLVDEDRQWFKSKCGLDVEETSREVSFCGHVVAEGQSMVVEDARKDERFIDNPLVTQEERPVVFYAGAPLKTKSGLVLGSLCIIAHEPATISDAQVNQLERLSTLVMDELELRSLLFKSRATEKKLHAKSKLVEERNQKLMALIERFKSTRARLINAEKVATIGLVAAGSNVEARRSLNHVRKLLMDSQAALSDDKEAGRLGQALEELDKLNRITSALNGVAEKAANNQFSESDLNATVKHCRNILLSRFNDKLRFKLEHTELPPVRMVESQIAMALLNVMVNAAQSADGKVTIKVETYVKNGHAVVRITDNGDGMSQQLMERIMEPFVSEGRDSGNQGLGLAIAQGIIKDHGGVIRVQSEEGKGSRFTIALPLTQAATDSAPAKK